MYPEGVADLCWRTMTVARVRWRCGAASVSPNPNRYANPFIFIVPSADVSAVVPPARQCGIRRAGPSAREASCHLWPRICFDWEDCLQFCNGCFRLRAGQCEFSARSLKCLLILCGTSDTDEVMAAYQRVDLLKGDAG
jgi:hypothetical protein